MKMSRDNEKTEKVSIETACYRHAGPELTDYAKDLRLAHLYIQNMIAKKY